MASFTKKSWELQSFTAHTSNVNCLALGHKSGRVLVTGGDDKKVNLWAVGKHNCILSLSGHATPIQCVRFNITEDLVCAGSQVGVLKIWDLEQTKLVRTLTGHKNAIHCTDFHPYGDFLASGSTDTAIKLWDMRRKGCIFTYKGHNKTVNSLKFSPDGQWIASAGEEGMVKVWDLRVGKQLKEFSGHKGAATTIEFHPHEFLLASGSIDKTVHFWDLESFQLVSSTEQSHSPAIRCLYFSPGGECLYAGSTDVLKVFGWEPGRTLDTVPTDWGKVQDIVQDVAQSQLIGASFHSATVGLYICDLKKIAPLGGSPNTSSSFNHGNSLRKSFSREKPTGLRKHTMNVRTIEETDKCITDPEDEATYAEIPNVTEYRDIFQPNRSLSRTPPPEPEAFPEPHDVDPSEPQILHTMSNLNMTNTDELPPVSSPPSPLPPAPTLSLTKPGPVRVQPMKSSPPVHRNVITSTSQIRANLQANNGYGKAIKTIASVPPLRQNITPIPGKRSILSSNSNINQQPAGPQRSNSTLTSRAAPMVAVVPVIDDGKLKSRAHSPDSPSPKHYLKRQSSCRDGEQGYESDYPVQTNNIKHSPSDPALNRPNTGHSRSISLTRSIATSTTFAKNVSNQTSFTTKKNPNKVPANTKVEIRVPQLRPMINNNNTENDELVPMFADKPYGLEVETFLPNNYSGPTTLGYSQMRVLTEMSEAEVLNSIMRGHDTTMTVLTSRHRSLQIISSVWTKKDLKTAVDSAVEMNDLSVIVDLLGIITLKPAMWNLDLCNSLLGPIGDLLQSKYEMYINVGFSALRLILGNFATVIKSNVEAPLHTIGVDVSREERYYKCLSCYEKLSTIREILMKKQSSPGKIGTSFRELALLIRSLE